MLILKILESCKDPLDQQHIISRIENDYGTRIERKALGRNIALLKELGYDIRHGAEGYYIPPKTPALEQEDLRILVDSIEANEALDDIAKRELINRLYKI